MHEIRSKLVIVAGIFKRLYRMKFHFKFLITIIFKFKLHFQTEFLSHRSWLKLAIFELIWTEFHALFEYLMQKLQQF